MRLKYHKDTDSLSINLNEKTGAESLEVASGIIINLDKDNNIVGIDISQASQIINLSELEVSDIPHKSGS
ncbi:MAG: DUF2283 domain-containing protein [Nitrospinae bacterium]|nr:DUF2283 domain-containing protein [Nitrospinota bacterium]MBI3814065.1 DUF2283 domain-containing protein [Nitrospinota bacterium]